MDPLAPEYPWYTPYQFAGNNPIFLIDADGLAPTPSFEIMGPKYPALQIFTAMENYNSIFVEALVASNNTSPYHFNKVARGRALEQKKAENKVRGAIGEAIFYQRANAWYNNMVKYFGISHFNLGQKLHNQQVDVLENAWSGTLSLGVLQISVELKMVHNEVSGGAAPSVNYFEEDQWWNRVYEVKTIKPDSDPEDALDYIKQGISQLNQRTLGSHDIGILVFDYDTWMNLYNNEDYKQDLIDLYDNLRDQGHYLKLERDLWGEANRGMKGMIDAVKKVPDSTFGAERKEDGSFEVIIEN